MAATIAGIDHALEKYVKVVPEGEKPTESGSYVIEHVGNKILAINNENITDFESYALPMNRFDAAEAFKTGLKDEGLSKLLGSELSSALLKQHQISALQINRV